MLAYERRKADALTFSYPDGEKALQAAKKAVRDNPDARYYGKVFEDRKEGFEVSADGKVLERHIIQP